MEDEYEALLSNNTWDLVPRPPRANVVTDKWIFKHKFKADGSLNRYNAHWVLRGFTQHPGSLLYVDDIVLTASSVVLLQHTTTTLQQQFAMKDLGPFHHFLSVLGEQQPDDLFLHQSRYVQDLKDTMA
jgi:hypothetical protein